MTPNITDAANAAELLGVDLLTLARLLRDGSQTEGLAQVGRICRNYERPNMGLCRALLRAAEACEKAYDEELGAGVYEDAKA